MFSFLLFLVVGCVLGYVLVLLLIGLIELIQDIIGLLF